ncbi:GntR family transcriptional regulator [Streptomonospora sp. PA3]|uniref:GntR family transcriptional regulator n=1 Tax=Streptomonospora sp. PA3 TaxID=2607326 RepID=UPI0012DDE36B|nr:GntR family transcriptional regulator [Streptomonospora sp. PA3]MUL44326.1 GntR family transcriptional regulator [Streptomonospora sp. PA3]
MNATGIYDQLRADILAGAIPLGAPVREVAVAERFGVSRTPVREALRRLQHDRLLEAGPRGGLYVRTPGPEEVMQIYEARILLEAEAARQAAHARGVADLAHLEGLLARDRALADPDDATRASTNLEFHEALWQATHNPVHTDLLHRLPIHLVSTQHSTLSAPGRWEEALEEHARIVAAVADRDADTAAAVARRHMRTARDIRIRILREQASTRAP